MVNLTRASKEMFRRTPDQWFNSLEELRSHCQQQKEASCDRWQPPAELQLANHRDRLAIRGGSEDSYVMNDWSFGQLCKLASVARDTVNRLTVDTAQQVLMETLPRTTRPMQIFTQGENVRSIHGPSYTRLYNADLMEMLQVFQFDFQPPPTAITGATGLYAGEQDLFCFLMDPLGWVEIGSEAFAPGFFVWNSEVGRRSFGVQTFWLQAVCQNHIVWDAVEVVEYTRKHTANVKDGLMEMVTIVERLVRMRDDRRDAFAKKVAIAMQTSLGQDCDEVTKALAGHGIGRELAKQAYQLAEMRGKISLFTLIDGLTRLAGGLRNGAERVEADQKAGALLALAS